MLSPNLETYLLTIYEMSLVDEEIKSSDLSRTLNIPLKKTIQALQRLHYQKFISYSAYQPIMFSEKGIEMAKYLKSKHELIKEFISILQLPESCVAEEEAMKQYLSDEALESIERFVMFINQYPEITNRYKQFNKKKVRVKILDDKPEE